MSRDFSFPLNDEQVRDLRRISEVSLGELRDISKALHISARRNYTKNELSDLLSAHDAAYADGLALLLYGLRRNIELQDFSVEEMINAVTSSLDDEFDDSEMQRWKDLSPIISDMLNSNYVIVFTKLRLLRQPGDQHVHSLSIVSEIRPVFNKDRDEIAIYFINNVLNIVVADMNEMERTIALPLGVEDLKRIEEQARSAIAKTKLLQKRLTTVDSVMPYVYRAHP